jgi:NADPH:quinone reductase-like Zn-dependent oxidoreductase
MIAAIGDVFTATSYEGWNLYRYSTSVFCSGQVTFSGNAQLCLSPRVLVNDTPGWLPLDAVRRAERWPAASARQMTRPSPASGWPGQASWPAPVREVVAPLAEQAANGRLQVQVATRLPLEQASERLAIIAEGNARGKIVVTIED